ncbi:hypothetical protein [Bradyrhizobium sp. BRP56]|uniref:hypothetical protein n=1 Tax=Bradyrhizobium sp. BRP56 TaxID=2793819 RepID=UPI001CD4F8EB|nr:hypothetical protein [Bradyrhizobium sp. BRP56]MCA1400365.1 hypothetical protein [Bradyrhizobium sp. BRP56]
MNLGLQQAWRRGGRSGAAVDGEANVQGRTEPVPILRRSRMTIRVNALTIDVTANPRFISKRKSAAIGSCRLIARQFRWCEMSRRAGV